MPSEGRRQRQQRVRHEAGDYVPSVPKEEAVGEKPAGEKDWVKVGNKEPGEAGPKEPRTVDPRIMEPSATSSHRRKDSHKSKDRGRGRGGGGRGEGRAEQGQRNNKKPNDSQVAYAEERTFEPVMIMGATPETAEVPAAVLAAPSKYRRKEVISNWYRYDDLPPEEDELAEGEDYLLGEDFSEVLSLNANKSSGGFLHLKGEASWGSSEPTVGGHGLGALKVPELVAALETLPLHQQLKIPEEALPVFTLMSLRASAEANRAAYAPDRHYVTDLEVNAKILESLKLSENEPLRLSTEGSESRDGPRDAVEAALKFSSAFVPEPDDVDLDTLGHEGGGALGGQGLEDERKREDIKPVPDTTSNTANKKHPSTTCPNTNDHSLTNPTTTNPSTNKSSTTNQSLTSTTNPSTTNPSIANPSTTNSSTTNPSRTSPPKTGFDFGLSTQSLTPSDTKRKGKKEKVNVAESKPAPPAPAIDLDQAPQAPIAPPVLVSKSEVENLEDWLDSVLDD